MTEQIILANSTDNQSTSQIIKESNSLETLNVNSFIRRSVSNKLNVLPINPTPTMITTSISSTTLSETDSIAKSINNTIVPVTTTLSDESKLYEMLLNIGKCASLDQSDSDSFDDEDDEGINSDLFYSSVSSASLGRGTAPCPICLELSALKSSSCCTFRCCQSCWRAHILSAINDGRIKISCISNECNKYLTRESIINFIRHDLTLHDRYLKLYSAANQNSRAKTCPRCSHLYSLDSIIPIVLKNSKKSNKKIPKQVQCSECSFVWCFRCAAPWHENLTCKQFLKGDKLLLKWIDQKSEEQWNARKCPKCSSVIQRAGGCPHMTCSSCACEFCYLCGRRYIKIPIIGQHNNKFSVLGCPYNLHPEKPWLRRTIRGMLATGIVVASPLIVAGAVTAAVTVLPSVGIYKFVRHVRSRRRILGEQGFGRPAADFLSQQDSEEEQQEQLHELLEFDMHDDALLRLLRRLKSADNTETTDENIVEDFPLSVFVDMDVENLFLEDDKPISDFRTCPTTPAINVKEDHGQTLDNLIINDPLSLTEEH